MDVKSLTEEIAELEEQLDRELTVRGAGIDNLLQQIAVRKARLRQLEAAAQPNKKAMSDVSEYQWP